MPWSNPIFLSFPFQTRAWVCEGDSDISHVVGMYRFGADLRWTKTKNFGDNKYPLLMLEPSQDETFVIGTFMTGFLLWRVDGEEDKV